MRNDMTDITIVLDRSGSMEAIREDAVGGFNRFLRDQQAADGQARLTLVQFDHLYEPLYQGLDIRDAKALDQTTFVPRGSTALLDAIGRTIKATGDRLSAMTEAERP